MSPVWLQDGICLHTVIEGEVSKSRGSLQGSCGQLFQFLDRPAWTGAGVWLFLYDLDQEIWRQWFDNARGISCKRCADSYALWERDTMKDMDNRRILNGKLQSTIPGFKVDVAVSQSYLSKGLLTWLLFFPFPSRFFLDPRFYY